MATVNYRDITDTTSGPSPAIWSNCPWELMREDPSIGYYFFDDFVAVPTISSQTQTAEIANGRYKIFASTDDSVVPALTFNSVATPGGIISLTGGTDNHSASIALNSPSFRLSGSSTTSGKLWFEARVATSSIATNGQGFAVGLAETTLWTFANGVPFNGGDAITNSASFIGFRYPEDDTTTADTVYSDRATSFTNIGDAELTLAALTWTKLGMMYDPDDSSKCIRFFQDGTELSSGLTRAQLTAMTNLDAGLLAPMAAIITDTAGTSIVFYMDWWRVAQLRP